MSLGTFLNRRKGEILLVLLSAWATAMVTLNGFHLDSMTAQYGYGVRAGITLAGTLVLSLVLYVASYNRQRRALGIIAFLVVAAVFIVAGMLMGTGDSPYEDVEGNYLYFAVDLVVVSAVCFLLTRTLAGSMLWFVISAFACSLTQAFFTPNELGMSLLAAVSGLSLVVYRNFRMGVEGAQLVKGKSSRYAFVSSVIPVLVALGVAAAAWFLVISPLNPGVLNIKLFVDYRQLPIEEYVGTSAEHPQFNTDMTSQNLNDGGDPYTTDDLREDSTSDVSVDAASALEQRTMQNLAGSGSGSSSGGGTKQAYSDDSTEEIYNPISYQSDFPWVVVWIVLALVVLACIVAFFLARRALRVRRLRGYLALEPGEQIKAIYRFLLVRMERIGFAQPSGMSLEEFAATSARQMDTVTEETKVSFEALTSTYVACVYGGIEPTEDEVVPFAAFYLRFWKAARSYLGNLRYFFKSFRL